MCSHESASIACCLCGTLLVTGVVAVGKQLGSTSSYRTPDLGQICTAVQPCCGLLVGQRSHMESRCDGLSIRVGFIDCTVFLTVHVASLLLLLLQRAASMLRL